MSDFSGPALRRLTLTQNAAAWPAPRTAPLGRYPSNSAPSGITLSPRLGIVVPVLPFSEQMIDLPLWVYRAIVLPLATILTIMLRPMVEGGPIVVLFKLAAGNITGDGDSRGEGWQ